MLKAPEFVGIVLNQTILWSTTINADDAYTACLLNRASSSIADRAGILCYVLDNGTGAISRQARRTRNGLGTTNNILLECGTCAGTGRTANDHDLQIRATNLIPVSNLAAVDTL